MKSIRIFFAIDIPKEVKTILENFILKLQEFYSNCSVRWSQLDHLHVTLHFLAAVKEDDIDLLISNVKKSIGTFPIFEIEMEKLELFPASHHPHVISLKVISSSTLMTLTQLMGNGILMSHYTVETRSFRPHLTLARLGKMQTIFLPSEIEIPKLKIEVKNIALYQSQPAKGSSTYTLLSTIPLK